MQEIYYDLTETFTENPTLQQLMEAAENPRNKEVRLIPDLNQKHEYYMVKKKGKWVKRKY